MPNSKISELKESLILHSDYLVHPFPHQAKITPPGSGDNNASFMIARENLSNENISYSHLKSSILDKSFLLTGKQLISGGKIFSDPCTFLSRTNVNEVLDNTLTGDISGNVFVGTSGLFQNIGASTLFHERHDDPSYRFHISGDSCFIGGITHTGYHRQEGDIYRIGDSSFSGDYYITGDSFRIGDVTADGNYYLTGDFFQTGNSSRYGDQLIIGGITHTGYHRQEGDIYRIGDSSFSGDYYITGDSFRIGDVRAKGDYYLTGDYLQTGDSILYGDSRVTGDVHVGEFIYHYQDEDTFINFSDDRVSLTAGGEAEILISETDDDFISFSTSGSEQAVINNSGFLGINTRDTLGELSVTGDSFLENVFVFDEFSKRFNKVFGGNDETVSFKTTIKGGGDKYHINLPKTFKEKPILSVTLQNCGGNILVPFILQSGNTHEFYMQFSNTLPLDNYTVDTTALCSSIMQNKNELNYDQFPYCSAMDPGAKRHGIQRFYFTPKKESSIQEIKFPLIYDDPPSISINIEGLTHVVPHIISNVTKESFTLKLGAKLNENHTVHCFSSSRGIHRLGEKVIYNAQWFKQVENQLVFRDSSEGTEVDQPEFVTSMPALELWELNSESGTLIPRDEPCTPENPITQFFQRTGNYLTTR